MADQLVVVNGVPGAGKTTLAPALTEALNGTLICKDSIKEALADVVAADLPTSALGALALDNLWRLAAMIDGLVVVEGFWLVGRDDEFFASAYAGLGSPPAVEVWCEAPIDVMRGRFRNRPRHTAHDDERRQVEWERFAREASPISGFDVVRVDTSDIVPISDIAARVWEKLQGRVETEQLGDS